MRCFKKIYYLLAAGILLNFFSVQIVLSQQESIQSNPSVDVLEVKSEDLLGVLHSIAIKTGLKIVVHPKLEGKVTIYLKDVNVYDVLRIILEANGLAFYEFDVHDPKSEEIIAAKLTEGKIILGELKGAGIKQPAIEVMTAQEFEFQFGSSFGQKIQTRIIALVYSKPEDIIKILDQMKTPSGKIIYNEQTNTLVLIDVPDKVEAMAAVVKEWDAPLTTKRFNLIYAKAQDIFPSIKEALNKVSGKVEIDVNTNALIVTDQPLRLKEIETLIKALDTEEKQILIEVKILKIILSDEHQEGIDWEAIVSHYQSLRMAIDLPSPPENEGQTVRQNFNVSDKKIEETAEDLSLGTISEEDYPVLLDALDTVGDIQIISNMKLSTLNNKSTELLVKTVGPQPPDKTQARIPPGIEEKEDVVFKILPLVNKDKTMALTINPGGISSIEKEGEDFHQVSINVPEGSTVVVGGLFKETMVELKEKIPLLGDIPILGLAFRHQGPRPRKAEIIIFLTPKLTIQK